MKDDIIVEILKYGKTKKPGKEQGFTLDDITNYLKSLGFIMDLEEITTLNVIIERCFRINIPSTGQYVMTAEGYFTLLEYQELHEARESSKSANNWAIIALTVSIIATLSSIGFSIKQINTPTEIKQNQIDQIIQVIKKQNNLIDSLLKINQGHHYKSNTADTSKIKQNK